MASTCPNCGKKLHFWNVKAECSDCGVSIPNFNWTARLEEDNIVAEKKFSKFYKNLNAFAYSVWGTKLRIVRIILSVLPAVGYILPWAAVKSETTSFGIDLIGLFTDGESLINVFKNIFGNFNLISLNMGFENNAGPSTYFLLSILFMVLSLLLLVIAFFLILFTFKKPKNYAMFVFDILGISSAITSAIMINNGVLSLKDVTAFNFGNFSLYNANGSIMWGYFVALALMVVAAVFNFLVAKAPAKSDEVLEEERLARKAIKEEKEREREIKREKEREEAERKNREEQARIVEEAREKLAKKKK